MNPNTEHLFMGVSLPDRIKSIILIGFATSFTRSILFNYCKYVWIMYRIRPNLFFLSFKNHITTKGLFFFLKKKKSNNLLLLLLLFNIRRGKEVGTL